MITVERTFDADFIYACAMDAWDGVTDDGSVERALYFPDTNHIFYWLMMLDDHKPFGVFWFHPINSICYEAHTMPLKIGKGKVTEAARAAVAWMFENTDCLRVITEVPAYNVAALALANRAGLREYGINPKSFLKNGVLYDQHLLGINKGEN